MKIHCLTPFLDGPERFEKDDVRTVDDERGARFVAAGWAKDVSGELATGQATDQPVDLDIQNVTNKQGLKNG